MRKLYVWEHGGWPYLTWNNKELSALLGEVRNKQGLFVGKISLIGDDLKIKTLLDIAVADVMASARLEGVVLDEEMVMMTSGRYLTKKKYAPALTDDASTGAANIYADSLYNCNKPVSAEQLFLWKYALEGKSDFDTSALGWMQPESLFAVASTEPTERKMEYFRFPIPADTAREMSAFIDYVNTVHPTDPVIKAGVVYLRFLLIRPFDCDNGRIARNLANRFLSRADNVQERMYSLAAQIESERSQYYNILLSLMQTADLDITEWLRWFLYSVDKALDKAENALTHVVNKAKFFDRCRLVSLNERQLQIINILWDSPESSISTSTYASLSKCSPDTALRDIQDLINKNILQKDYAGGRSTSYQLK
jgi:Fic family protein